MEGSHLQIATRTKDLLDHTYPHGYKVIYGHSYDSNCVGWLVYRLKQDVFRYDDEEFDPRKILMPATELITDLARKKMKMLGCSGKG